LHLSNFNLRLDLIKTLFFKGLTYLNRSDGKFCIVLKKKSAQSVYFYRFYDHFKFCLKINLHNFCLLNIIVKPVKIVQLSWFFFQNYVKFFTLSNEIGWTLKNEVLVRSSHKLRFKRRECIHSKKQPLISLNLKYFMIQMKLGYLKSILQSRSSLLPSYYNKGAKMEVSSFNCVSALVTNMREYGIHLWYKWLKICNKCKTTRLWRRRP